MTLVTGSQFMMSLSQRIADKKPDSYRLDAEVHLISIIKEFYRDQVAKMNFKVCEIYTISETQNCTLQIMHAKRNFQNARPKQSHIRTKLRIKGPQGVRTEPSPLLPEQSELLGIQQILKQSKPDLNYSS